MKNLKNLRERKDLKQVDVARALNIPKNTYSNYENDVRQPDYETLQKIANYFNVSIDYLLDNKKEDKFYMIKLSEEQYQNLKDIVENVENQIKTLNNNNIVIGNENRVEIKNSYNKNK